MVNSFNEKCYELLKSVPKGKVVTYSDIAHALNCKAYRAVGNAMNKNPHDTKKVPCHRVVNSNGRIGGYAWQENLKVERLEEEGVPIDKKGSDMTKWKIKDFSKVRFNFFD